MAGLRNLITLNLCLVAYSCLLTAHAQDSVLLRQTIAILSSDQMRGRGGSYDGEWLAATWIRSELSKLPNALPMGEKGLQKYAYNAFKMEGPVRMELNGKLLDPRTEYRIAPASQTTHLDNAPIIRVPASILVDTPRLERFIAKNYKKLQTSFVYIDNTEEGKYRNSAAPIDLKSFQVKNPFPSKGILIGVDELPIWTLNATDFERNFALIYVLNDHLSRKSSHISLHFSNTFYKKETQNVCFAIEGREYPDEFVVFTAHYDHLGCMGDSVIFPGAHDNASGVGTVMQFAQYYSHNSPAYTTVFLLFSGEESGLRGSYNFVKHPLIPLDKIKLLVNIDMMCGGDEGIMVVNGTEGTTKSFVDMMEQLNADNHYVAAVKRRTNAANSDHYYFSKKCPAIFVYTLGGKYGGYHNYTDTCDNCGLASYNGIFTLLRESVDQFLHH